MLIIHCAIRNLDKTSQGQNRASSDRNKSMSQVTRAKRSYKGSQVGESKLQHYVACFLCRSHNFEYPTRKIYMMSHLEPSVEITGGPWYSENELDTEFIKMLASACLRFIKDKVQSVKIHLITSLHLYRATRNRHPPGRWMLH